MSRTYRRQHNRHSRNKVWKQYYFDKPKQNYSNFYYGNSYSWLYLNYYDKPKSYDEFVDDSNASMIQYYREWFLMDKQRSFLSTASRKLCRKVTKSIIRTETLKYLRTNFDPDNIVHHKHNLYHDTWCYY